MDIAFFTETYFPQINGVTYTVDNWREGLERHGHNVYVVYPESRHEPRRREIPIPSFNFRPVDGYHIGVSFPSDISSKIPDVDVVHTHGEFSMGVLAARLARKKDVPLVCSYHTPGEQYFDYVSRNRYLQKAMDKLYLQWERWFYRRCAAIFAPSDDASGRLEERIGMPVHTMSNGINTSFFAPVDQEQVDAFREKYNITADTVVGFCGRLGYEKNVDDVIRFAQEHNDSDGEDVAVVVAGDGFAKKHYLPRFAEAGVNYVGRLDREEMPAFYTMLDVFLMPSLCETQGVSVLEANACGTPAVGADAKALKNTIQNGVNGYRYEAGDIAALEDCVGRVLAHRETLEENARRTAQGHSIGAVVNRLEAVYQEVSGSPHTAEQVGTVAAEQTE